MRIIYCDSGFSPKEVDYMYAEEYKSAKSKFSSVFAFRVSSNASRYSIAAGSSCLSFSWQAYIVDKF